MKLRRLWIILLVLAMLLALNFCSKTRVSADQNVTLLFIYEDKNITATLTDEEAAKVMKKNRKQVDNLLYRAKKELRIILGEDGELLL